MGRLKEYFPDVKFRRQHPISLYIADFYCHSKKLIIEIDGSIHLVEEVKENDIIRQQYLESLGIEVLRFNNNDIFNHLETVLQKIKKKIK